MLPVTVCMGRCSPLQYVCMYVCMYVFFSWGGEILHETPTKWVVSRFLTKRTNYQQDSTHRWLHDDTQKWRFYILRDESSGWMSQGSTRLKVNDFKMISRWLQDVFKNSRWTNSRDGPFGRIRRISPLEDNAILIRFCKRRTILQETGPSAVCEGSARLKKTPSLSFYLKIFGTTI